MNKASITSVIIAVLTAVLAAFATPVQNFFGSHPTVTALVLGAWGVVAHYLPAPKVQ
jgi:hypothetical protein